MLLTKKANIKWNRKTCTHFKNMGYKFTKIGDEFEADVQDLPKGSHAIVDVQCDYCSEQGIITIVKKEYRRYINEQSSFPKDSCNKCKTKKLKDSMLDKYGTYILRDIPGVDEKRIKTVKEKYGCENVFQNEEIKEKIKATNLIKYGVGCYTQTEEYKEKTIATNLEKYGVEWHMQSPEFIDKVTNTSMERYGVNHYTQTEEYKEKTIATNLEKYGVEWHMQNEEIKQKAVNTHIKKYGMLYTQTDEYKQNVKITNIKKYGVDNPMRVPEIARKAFVNSMQGLKANNAVNTSIQQKHIYNLFNGEINYLEDNCFLDIAFPKDKIYVEYQGSGHDISVKYGKMTQAQFNNKEMKRYFYLKSKGWKMIEIISKNDYLPNDDIFIKILKESKNILMTTDNNWIKYDIDNNLIITKKNVQSYDFGELRKIN